MLNRLVLTNFKRHESLDVSFTTGLNVVFGDNYKGKTTLFYAFLYALGGPTLVPGGAARIDRVDTVGGKFKAEVACYFTVAGNPYYVERSASKCNLYRTNKEGEPAGWVRMANSAKNVADELAAILGFPVRRLANMKYAEQDHMGALLTLGAGELNKIVEEVAEVEIVDTALKGCSGIIKTTNAQLEVLSPVGEDVMMEKQTELTALESEALSNAGNLQVLEQELLTADQALSSAKEATHSARLSSEQIVASNRKAEEHNRARAVASQTLKLREERLGTLASEVNPLVDQLAELGEAAQLQERLKDFTSERDSMRTEINQASLAAERRAQAEKTTQLALTKSGQAVVALNDANKASMIVLGLEAEGEDTAVDLGNEILGALTEAVTDLAARKEAANEVLIEARSKVQRMTQAIKDSTCPECNRPFDNHDPEKLEAELEVAGITVAAKEREVALTTTQITAHAKEKRTLEGALEAYAAADREVVAAQQNLVNTPQPTAELSVLQEKVKLADQHITVCNTKLNQINNLSDRISRLQNEHANVAQEVTRLADELRAMQDMALEQMPDLGPYLESQQAAQAQRDLAATRVQVSQQLSQQRAWKIESLKKELADAEKVLAQSAAVSSRRQDTMALQVYVKSNRDRFMSEMWDGVLAQASQFASDCTDGDIRSISRIDEEFFFDEGLAEVLPVKGSASGAQRTFMGIGVQLALSMMMNTGFNTLLLDEPAAALRDERSVALVAALKASGQQVIIISHSMADAALADNTIEIY